MSTLRQSLVRLVPRIFDPLILWCHGWTRLRWDHGPGRPYWRDPVTGWIFAQSDAIRVCETRAAARERSGKGE